MPSCESAGTTGEPLAFAIVIVIGAANCVTGVPASAQWAVTSISWLPGARLGANAASAGDGSTRRTRKSSAVGGCGQAAGGSETVASDPAEVTTDVWVGDALSSTGGRSAAGRALDRDGDAEGRARAARVLEPAGEHVQPVGERAGGERQGRAGDGRRRRGGAVEQGAGDDGGLARGEDDLSSRTSETEPSCGDDETSRGAVLSNLTPGRTEGADGLPNVS